MDNYGFISKLSSLLQNEQKYLDRIQCEYNSLPPGRLYVKDKCGYMCIYVYEKGMEKGIKRDHDLIGKLARKRFLEQEIWERKISCKIIKDALNKLDDTLRQNKCSLTMSRLSKMPQFTEAVLSDEEYEWKRLKPESNPYKPEHLKYYTGMGVKVRSKSELIIAGKLEQYNVLYKYEAPFKVQGTIYYPDFMIRNSNGNIFIWEHFGLMDNEEYYYKACRKINKFRSAGFVQHSNLICTYEEDLEKPGVLDSIIQRFLI